jgi:hypothetical protein
VGKQCSSAGRVRFGIRLFVRDGSLGALNLYSGEPGVFTKESSAIGEVLAQHAAVAMVGAAADTQFRNASPPATSSVRPKEFSCSGWT